MRYDVPIDYLAETLNEPKVIPMIRGKAFEFTSMLALRKLLDSKIWLVEKKLLNAQSGSHDVDVGVTYLPTQKEIRVECKLAKKGSFRVLKPDVGYKIDVKCMRSRTLGEAKVIELAPKLGLTVNELTVHNDQYLPTDFDFVLTSIGNAFYTTGEEVGSYEWSSSEGADAFFAKLHEAGIKGSKSFAYHKLYIARARDLAVAAGTNVACSRRACKNKHGCGFIPNYPAMFFNQEGKVLAPWYEIDDAEKQFSKFIMESKGL